MERLNQLRAAHSAAQTRAQEALDAVLALADDAPADVVDAAEAEVTEAEAEALRCKTQVDKREALLRSRESHTPEPITADAAAAVARHAVANGQLREEHTYRYDAQFSFFKDLKDAKGGDSEARERLFRNNRETGYEKRAGINQTLTSGGEFVPPVWLNDMYAQLYRNGRPFLDALGTKPLPPNTNSLNFPKITTGDTVAVQADGGAVSNTDLVTATVTAQVQTVAGRAVASYQVVDLGTPAMDQVLYGDLIAAYAAEEDRLAIAGNVANAKGVLNTTGINAVTYTSASPKQTSATVADSAYYQVFLAKNGVEKTGLVNVDFAVVHPSFWNWYLSGIDSSLRPLSLPSAAIALNPTGLYDVANEPTSPRIAGAIAGIPVVTDPNVPVNLGGGTNESRVILLNRRGLDVWESTPVFKIADQTSIATLQYQFVLYGYYAITSRQAKMISVVAGTGMIVQAGF